MYNPNEQKDNIDKVKESLYSKNTDAIFVKRRYLQKFIVVCFDFKIRLFLEK